MKELVDLLLKRLEEQKGSVLVVIVQHEGSAPRGVGAAMLAGENGYLAGTIGGGMLEYRAAQQAAEDLAANMSALRHYRLQKQEAAALGMVCGGDVLLRFQVILPSAENMRIWQQVQSCMKHFETGWLVLSLTGTACGFVDARGEVCGMNAAELPELSLHTECPFTTAENQAGERFFLYRLTQRGKVYLFGGGHLAQELVPLLARLDFYCVVTDDRSEFSTAQLFPQAQEIYTCAFDQLGGHFEIQPQDYIIAMTRGHLGDLEVQKFALRTAAAYIGVVGSRNKIAAVNEQLRASGFSEQELARITTPIGIPIQSETPAEIAVSIAAQLIEQRAKRRGKE